jgi:Aldo/keto reductase family
MLRSLGKTGLEIAPLVFGGNVLGWTIDEKTSFQVLDAFIDHGFNAIDTADVYSAWGPGNKGGESETIIGKWLKGRAGIRDKVTIFTKVGFSRRSSKSLAKTCKSGSHSPVALGSLESRGCPQNARLHERRGHDPRRLWSRTGRDRRRRRMAQAQSTRRAGAAPKFAEILP